MIVFIKKQLRSLFQVILIFLYIYGPVFRPIGSWFDLIFFISIIVIIIDFTFNKIQSPRYFNKFIILIPLHLYLLLSIGTVAEADYTDYIRFLLKPIRIIITLYAGFILVKYFHRLYGNKFSTKLFFLIFLSICIHALIMAYQLFNPEFKDWVYFYTATDEFRSSFDYNFRMGGFSGGSGGAVLSVTQSIGIILMPFILRNKKKWEKIIIIVGSVIIFYSILISGRSGIYPVLLLFPFSVIYASGSINLLSVIRGFISIFIIIILFSLIFVLYDKYVVIKSPIYYALSRSLDTFLEFRSDGSFDDQTIEILKSQILLPSNLSTWIFGNGEHLVLTQYHRTLNSDIGFIRNLWGMGLFGAFIYIYPLLSTSIIVFRKREKYRFAGLFLLISVVMIAYDFKENFLYVRMLWSIYSLVLFILYFDSKYNYNTTKIYR